MSIGKHDFSKDISRLINRGHAKDEAEAKTKLTRQEELAAEAGAQNKKIEELNKNIELKRGEVIAEMNQRLEIVKQIYERRQEKILKHFQEMLKTGVSPFHEELRHESERLSQIDQDFRKERSLFDQFDAEDRVAAVKQFREAIVSNDALAIRKARRNIEDVFYEQNKPSYYEKKLPFLFNVLRAWAKGEIKLGCYYSRDEKGDSMPNTLSMEEYKGYVGEDGYLNEDIVDKIINLLDPQGVRTKDKKGFCLECDGHDIEDSRRHIYEPDKLEMNDWIHKTFPKKVILE